MSVFYLFSDHSKDEKIIFYASFYSLQFDVHENAFQIFSSSSDVSPLSFHSLVVVTTASCSRSKSANFFWSAFDGN